MKTRGIQRLDDEQRKVAAGLIRNARRTMREIVARDIASGLLDPPVGPVVRMATMTAEIEAKRLGLHDIADEIETAWN